MTFSLINVTSENENGVSGYWLQDKIGTLEEAKQLAQETNFINGGKLDIAVTPAVNSTVPALDFHKNLKRL